MTGCVLTVQWSSQHQPQLETADWIRGAIELFCNSSSCGYYIGNRHARCSQQVKQSLEITMTWAVIPEPHSWQVIFQQGRVKLQAGISQGADGHYMPNSRVSFWNHSFLHLYFWMSATSLWRAFRSSVLPPMPSLARQQQTWNSVVLEEESVPLAVERKIPPQITSCFLLMWKRNSPDTFFQWNRAIWGLEFGKIRGENEHVLPQSMPPQ